METKIIIGIKDELRSFAENKKSEMSVNVYNHIWGIVQSIDYDLEKLNKENKNATSK